ncbi:MAG: Hydantoinase/oxoprolinase N-terminal region [Panacagrimonas sp.]|nr:Hydantoinase/oxoprolinase N-terminal region [Panacagrimonas sp.]
MKATRHTRISGTKNWIALDSGGTMTDAVVVDTSGGFLVGKYLTNKQNESVSVLGAITDASKPPAWNRRRRCRRPTSSCTPARSC